MPGLMLDLAGLALERGIQAPAQHIEVALVDQAGVLVRAELGQEAVAVVQLGHQCAALDATWRTFHWLRLSSRASWRSSAPFVGQALQQRRCQPWLRAPAAELAC
jgi:hypothetical protein